MGPAASSDDGDLARLAAHGHQLADAVAAALPAWVVDRVRSTARAWEPGLDERLGPAAAAAGAEARAEVEPALRELAAADPDEARPTPLAIVRGCVHLPTRVLADAGVGEVVRDPFDVEAFPDDVYGLSPASLADLGPRAHEAGLAWGAAKAHVVLARRRAEGLR